VVAALPSRHHFFVIVGCSLRSIPQFCAFVDAVLFSAPAERVVDSSDATQVVYQEKWKENEMPFDLL